MSIGRKKALERLEALALRVEEHFDKIEAARDDPAVNHWRTEIRAWLDQMNIAVPHVGRRSGEAWTRMLQRWQERLERNDGDR
jgi:hypothetical protein